MYCKHCGTKLDNDALFCSKCGTKVAQDDSALSFLKGDYPIHAKPAEPAKPAKPAEPAKPAGATDFYSLQTEPAKTNKNPITNRVYNPPVKSVKDSDDLSYYQPVQQQYNPQFVANANQNFAQPVYQAPVQNTTDKKQAKSKLKTIIILFIIIVLLSNVVFALVGSESESDTTNYTGAYYYSNYDYESDTQDNSSNPKVNAEGLYDNTKNMEFDDIIIKNVEYYVDETDEVSGISVKFNNNIDQSVTDIELAVIACDNDDNIVKLTDDSYKFNVDDYDNRAGQDIINYVSTYKFDDITNFDADYSITYDIDCKSPVTCKYYVAVYSYTQSDGTVVYNDDIADWITSAT